MVIEKVRSGYHPSKEQYSSIGLFDVTRDLVGLHVERYPPTILGYEVNLKDVVIWIAWSTP